MACATVVPVDRPWPWSERSHAIAMRRVADLATRDPELHEALAYECELAAAFWWERVREMAG